MKTLVDIPDNFISRLDFHAKQDKTSRADLIRRAIDAYLETRTKEILDATFGAWKDSDIGDAVEYQRMLRAEWDHRP
jgi:predicted transcriptional regulator